MLLKEVFDVWSGVRGFYELLSESIGQPQGLDTLLFCQSASIIRFAADCLLSHTKRVLTTDLVWPAYRRVLNEVANARGCELTTLPLKSRIFNGVATKGILTKLLTETIRTAHCDGLFLTDISNLGIGLPVEAVLSEVESVCRFVVVDGAQAFRHRPVNLQKAPCDLYLAGTHKWLCSYHPLRIAFAGRHRHRDEIEAAAREHCMHDPLLNFSRRLAKQDAFDSGETVNLAGLMAAAGAIQDSMKSNSVHRWNRLRTNTHNLGRWFRGTPFRPVLNSPRLSTGILLLRQKKAARILKREDFANQGLVVSTYPDGTIRLSMPEYGLSFQSISTIVRSAVRASLG